MKCNICGRNFVALGVHLKLKHKVDLNDYREEHGMLKAVPLVDDWLSDRMKKAMSIRLADLDYKEELTQRCIVNSKNNVGKTRSDLLSSVGKQLFSERVKARNDAYLVKKSVVVAKVLREKGTMIDVRRATGTGPEAGRKMAKIAGVEYSNESAKSIRDVRAAATHRTKAMARVALVMPYFYTTKSALEMCRLSGISVRTYKNWLAAGLIPRHPNGRNLKTAMNP